MNRSCSDTDENGTLSAIPPLEDDATRLRAAINLLEAAGYSVAAGSSPAQEALRESEQRYRAIVTAFDGAIYVCSPDYRITFMNEELIARRGNAVGAHCYQALHDLDAVCPWCVNERVFRGEVVRWEVQSPKDGRWYYSINSPIYHPDGTISKQAMIHDITERKDLEKALLESEKQFRSLSDSAPIGIFKSDSQGNCTYFNPRWEEITGFSASQGMGKGWRALIHPDDLEELTLAWSQAAASGSTYCHEHRHVTPQGETVWVRVLANPIRGEHGAILGHVGTLEDITGLRQARKEILKAQKLESIGILAGGIAHDFNNILTAILGNISLAAYQMDEPEKVAQRLADAESAASRAKDLTQQLLTFARGGDPIKKVIEVPGVLKEAVAFALHGSDLGCVFDIADGVWPLEADEGQLIQVIHNLVLNAVQSMPEGGTVTVGAHNEPSRGQGGDFVEIFVADSGVGISEQHLEKIFDPYFTTKRQGSGLGLASCYSIINKHGGTLKAESVLEQGSTFRVQLPASKRHQVVQPKAGSRMIPGNSRVLVMDDEEIVWVLAKAVLEQLGYQAHCVENGTRAVEEYRRAMEEGNPFAAVILDLTVPGGVGGKEAIRMLLAIDPRVKAIVCSGYSTDPVMSSYREHGFSAVLSKPYRPHDLSGVLQDLLAS
jgi:two-component system, cell cycle sensor histidine kinase and response regulator CckA